MLAVAIASTPVAPAICLLCGRRLGARVEWHHIVPRSEGGREVTALHPICHRAIRARWSNADLARFEGMAALREAPELAAFLRWIASRPPDFHAPTRTRG
ncbi:HNH endonuclease [Sphingomonas sp. CL5.1]|uniref:HNH endonuclease n=1 Tax=Sphingomonas sp. CL5.1 TaxID=2653203 RepID=UPI001582C1F0|nr:HNH endonuclease [Sphingomonas sp. CL5.1]QKS02211.1 HNH endonuclease [Sphingomonas sp. CL5.1]